MVRYIVSFAILFSYLIPINALAAPKHAYAEVDPRSGSIDDSFTLRLIIENGEPESAPELSDSQDFEIQQAGTESGAVMINNSISMRYSYLYVLTPKKTGMLETPKASVEVEGEKLIFDSRKIQVLSAAQNSSDPSQAGVESSQTFMSQSVDKKNVYLGEQVVNTIELFTSVGITDLEPLSSASNAVWQEVLESEHQGRKVIDGEHFRTVSMSYSLFPLKEGDLILEPRSRRLKVESKRSRRPGLSLDPFDDPFFGGITSFRSITLHTDALKLEVKPLPQKPAQFADWGATSVVVGKTELSVNFDSSDIEVGQSKTLQFKLISLGNINPLKSVPIREQSSYKIYRDAAQSKNFANANTLVSQTNFSVSIVPSKPGLVDLGEIAIGYFDPDQNSYAVAHTQNIKFQVTGNAQSTTDLTTQAPQSQTDTQSDVSNTPTPAPTTSPIKSQSTLTQEFRRWIHSHVSATLAVFCAVLIAGISSMLFLLLKFKGSNSRYQERLVKIQAANRISEIDLAFRQFLGYQMGLNQEIERASILSNLNSQLSDASLALNVQIILDKLENWQFSLNKPSEDDVQALKAEILELIPKLGDF